MKVQLFIPCFVDQLFPETAISMIKVLRKLGCEVLYNKSQTCCGQPAYNAGFWNDSRCVAEKFLNDFNAVDAIVAPGGSCVGFIRNHYEKLFASSALPGVVKPVQFFEFTEFLTNVLKVVDLGARFKANATYHDACGALRECGIKEGPRKLLSVVKDFKLIETDDCEVCCGFGGTFSVKFEAISTAMVEQKILNAVAKGVDCIVSTDSSCLLQMDGYIRQQRIGMRAVHIADVLASGW